jgi:hypothetical protein
MSRYILLAIGIHTNKTFNAVSIQVAIEFNIKAVLIAFFNQWDL